MTKTESADAANGGIYRTGGIAAWILLAYSLATLVQMVVFGGQPASAQEAFDMLAENRLVGLIRLDLLLILIMPLYYLFFLAFYRALKKTHPSASAVAALLGCAGLTLVLATPSVFSWLSLSDKFAAAAGDAQKAQFLAAGEAILASDMWHGSGAFVGGVMMQVCTTLVSIIMLGSKAFSRSTAWVGIVTHGLDLLHILVGLFLPTVGVIMMFIAGPLYLVWFPLLARDFSRLARTRGE